MPTIVPRRPSTGTVARVRRRARCSRSCCVAARGRALVAPPSRRAAEPAPRRRSRVQPSVEQVAVTGARPGAPAVLARRRRRHGRAPRTVDAAGSALFRDVRAGRGLRGRASAATASAPVTVHEPDDTPAAVALHVAARSSPATATSRRATARCSSVNVTLPGPGRRGPVPHRRRVLGLRPVEPRRHASRRRGIAQLLGYATVGVNMRGTGCSGGAFDYFEPLQSLDGYDVIETVAAQPWVAHGKVGMVGISYPGHHPALRRRDPPAAPRRDHAALGARRHLRSTLYPGGILNNGFALRLGEGPPGRRDRDQRRRRPGVGEQAHRRRRRRRARQPGAAAAGRRRARARSAPTRYRRGAGDRRARARDVRRTTSTCRCSSPARGRTRRPAATSPTCSTTSRPTSREGHADERRAPGLARPAVLSQWVEFLDFYVAQTDPVDPAGDRARSPTVAARPRLRAAASTLAARPLHRPARLRRRRSRAYEAEPPVRVLFDVGAGGRRRTGPRVRDRPRRRGRCPTRTATTWYLGADGTLDRRGTRRAGAPTAFAYDPAAFPRTMTTQSTATSVSTPRRTTGSRCPTGKALGVRDRAARRRHRDGRHRQRRPLAAVDDSPTSTSRSRSARCGPTARRPTCRAAGCARASARSTPTASTALLPVQTHATRRRRRRCPKGEADARAGAALPVRRTRSAPARGSASSCSRPAATGRRGRSTRSRPTTVTHRHGRRSPRRRRRRSCCRWCRGRRADAAARVRQRSAGQPCRDLRARSTNRSRQSA